MIMFISEHKKNQLSFEVFGQNVYWFAYFLFTFILRKETPYKYGQCFCFHTNQDILILKFKF